MTQRTQNIIVGITAMVGLAGLAVMLMLFGSFTFWGNGGYEVRVTFTEAGGLSQESRVRLAGIDIGKVHRIEFQDPAYRGVIVTATINPDVQIPVEAHVSIDRPLLGGSPALQFNVSHLAQHASVPMAPTDGSAAFEGSSSSFVGQFEKMADKALVQLRDELKGPKEQLGKLAEQLGHLSETWREVGQNINHLVEPRDPSKVDSGEALGNLTTVLARTDQRLREIEQVLAGIRAYVGDEQMRTDLKATVANARTVSENAVKLTENAQQQIEQLTRRVTAVADDMSAAIQSTQKLIEQARAGNGTVGLLLNNPSVYNNLNDASQRVTAAVDDLRLLIQKWREEGLPVKF
jgi:phospholipid/cholesterol/gamma-HCH transport system substrate-binding protein